MFYFGATQQKLRIPHGMDQNVSNMVKHEEDEEEQPPLQVGFAVEARPQNIDELYYAAEITAVRVSDTGAEITASYVVEYEDGTVEEDLPREALLYPQSRKEIFNDGVVRVVEGHACLNNQPVKARLMSFVESLHLIQSAVLVDGADPPVFDHLTQLFDVDQALAFALPLLLEFAEGSQRIEEKIDVAVIGAGGATLPMALVRKYPLKLQVSVVDNNENVLECARRFFGADSPEVELVLKDGLDFLRQIEDQSLDLLVIDVAAPGASSEAEVELPPAAFLQRESVELYDLKVQRRDGWLAMNVLASKPGLKRILAVFRDCFRHVYVLATDPNYVFFLSNANSLHERVVSSVQVTEAAKRAGYEEDVAHSVLEEVAATEEHAENKVLLGWFSSESFERLLDEVSVV